MKKVGIYAKENDKSLSCKEELVSLLKGENFIIDNDNPEIVIAIGGDGTFLRAAHQYFNREVAMVGVNAGHLGFFSEFDLNELKLLVDSLKNDNYAIRKHRLLKAEISSDSDSRTILALNEVRIENPFHTLIADVYVNDDHLETFRGNGLVVSSSIGSSAYNKSLGGAVVDTSLDILELTEIAAIQNNSFRSLNSSYIANGDKTIRFTGNFNEVVVGYDFETFHLAKASSILLSLSTQSVSIIHQKKKNHIKKLKESFIE